VTGCAVLSPFESVRERVRDIRWGSFVRASSPSFDPGWDDYVRRRVSGGHDVKPFGEVGERPCLSRYRAAGVGLRNDGDGPEVRLAAAGGYDELCHYGDRDHDQRHPTEYAGRLRNPRRGHGVSRLPSVSILTAHFL
jgi:hypothetical protein